MSSQEWRARDVRSTSRMRSRQDDIWRHSHSASEGVGAVVLGLKMGSKERTSGAADTMASSFGRGTVRVGGCVGGDRHAIRHFHFHTPFQKLATA